MNPWQQVQLVNQLAQAIPFSKRLPKVHISFHLNLSDKTRPWGRTKSSRAKALDHFLAMDPHFVGFMGGRMTRLETWKTQLPFGFVATSFGKGLDCHRTWESLQLGHVVLMLKTDDAAFWSMFDNLPVILLEDWAEVTPMALMQWHEEWSLILADPNRQAQISQQLSLGWWMENIRLGI